MMTLFMIALLAVALFFVFAILDEIFENIITEILSITAKVFMIVTEIILLSYIAGKFYFHLF
jgi:hypothetical protein